MAEKLRLTRLIRHSKQQRNRRERETLEKGKNKKQIYANNAKSWVNDHVHRINRKLIVGKNN